MRMTSSIPLCMLAILALALPTGSALSPQHHTHTQVIHTPAGTYYVHQEAGAMVGYGNVFLHVETATTVWEETNGMPGLQQEGDDADAPVCDTEGVPSPIGLPLADCGAAYADTTYW